MRRLYCKKHLHGSYFQIMQLLNNEIHCWFTNSNQNYNINMLKRYEQLLTEEEKENVSSFKFEHLRQTALITRVFIRSILSQYINQRPQEILFSTGHYGKPKIENCTSSLQFNLSHSGGIIVVAVCLVHDIGVDIEKVTHKNELLQLADRYFSPWEVLDLFEWEDENTRLERFYDYWTLKESYIKACGRGLSIPLNQFSFQIGGNHQSTVNEEIRLSFDSACYGDPAAWQSWLLYPCASHRLAISICDGGMTDFSMRFFRTWPLNCTQEVVLPIELLE